MALGRVRPAAVALSVASLLIGASACASGDGTEPVASARPAAEGDPTPSAQTPAEPSQARSVVTGIAPEELAALVAEEPPGAVRSRTGPTAERIRLADGTDAWRVRVPGSFPMGSARPFVLVDDQTVGQGVLTPALDALVVIVPGAEVLAAGAAVSVRWEQGTPQAVGRLEVLR